MNNKNLWTVGILFISLILVLFYVKWNDVFGILCFVLKPNYIKEILKNG